MCGSNRSPAPVPKVTAPMSTLRHTTHARWSIGSRSPLIVVTCQRRTSMMRTTFLATATSVAFFGLTLPTFAADNAQPAPTAPPAPAAALSLSQALLQAQVDKCLADGSITAQQVHAMADKELIAAL